MLALFIFPRSIRENTTEPELLLAGSSHLAVRYNAKNQNTKEKKPWLIGALLCSVTTLRTFFVLLTSIVPPLWIHSWVGKCSKVVCVVSYFPNSFMEHSESSVYLTIIWIKSILTIKVSSRHNRLSWAFIFFIPKAEKLGWREFSWGNTPTHSYVLLENKNGK